LNQLEIEAAVLAVLAEKGKMDYADLLGAIPGVSPERVAHAAWQLRANNKVKFTLTSQPGSKPLHTVELL